MILPQFKIYNVGNLGIGKSNFFIGNTYISDINRNNNKFSTFLFASIVGGRNVRIDQATEIDPYIFIDARFYTFKPYSYYVQYSDNASLNQLENSFIPTSSNFLNTIIQDITVANGDVNVSVKNLDVDSKFSFYTNIDNNEIIVKAPEYNLKNVTETKSIKILEGKTKDENGNTVFYINKLIEGNCLEIEQIFEYTW